MSMTYYYLPQISKILETFNSYHNGLQFTIEYEVNRKLSFMDLMLEVDDGVIIVVPKRNIFGKNIVLLLKSPDMP